MFIRPGAIIAASALALVTSCGESGPEGSVQADCFDYAQERISDWAAAPDGLAPGVVTVGFIKDTKIAAAKRFLETLETSYYIPTPWLEFAVICTDEGWEEHWVDVVKADPMVEWAHREGVQRQ
jgi:hypothetical protein